MTKPLLNAVVVALLVASPACGSKTSNEPNSQAGAGAAAAGAAGFAGAAVGGGGMGTGGAAGQSGSAGESASAGQSGAGAQSGAGGQSGAAGQSSSGGSAGAAPCTMGGNECASGYQCGCGGPGPSPGPCTCHKECFSAADCDAPNSMCGCSVNDSAPRICVSACFCFCG